MYYLYLYVFIKKMLPYQSAVTYNKHKAALPYEKRRQWVYVRDIYLFIFSKV